MNTEYHNNRLQFYKKVWLQKPILRKVYQKWYSWISADKAVINGPVIEVGAGIGNFKEYAPDTISTDISLQSWLDCICDAHALPFKPGSISTFMLVDVLHHLASPVDFFRAAVDILPPGGRIIVLEPYPTLFSRFAYARVHAEPFLFEQQVLSQSNDGTKEPWQANQAVSYLLFGKYRKAFEQSLENKVTLIKWMLSDCIFYPLTGGFNHDPVVPLWLFPLINIFEKILNPLRRFFAFRCYAVWEKQNIN